MSENNGNPACRAYVTLANALLSLAARLNKANVKKKKKKGRPSFAISKETKIVRNNLKAEKHRKGLQVPYNESHFLVANTTVERVVRTKQQQSVYSSLWI